MLDDLTGLFAGMTVRRSANITIRTSPSAVCAPASAVCAPAIDDESMPAAVPVPVSVSVTVPAPSVPPESAPVPTPSDPSSDPLNEPESASVPAPAADDDDDAAWLPPGYDGAEDAEDAEDAMDIIISRDGDGEDDMIMLPELSSELPSAPRDVSSLNGPSLNDIEEKMRDVGFAKLPFLLPAPSDLQLVRMYQMAERAGQKDKIFNLRPTPETAEEASAQNKAGTAEARDDLRRMKMLNFTPGLGLCPGFVVYMQKLNSLVQRTFPAFNVNSWCLIMSLPGCPPQMIHRDVSDEHFKDWSAETQYPRQLIFSLQRDVENWLDMWPYSHLEATDLEAFDCEKIELKFMEAVMFRGDVAHRGAANLTGKLQIRVHVFLDPRTVLMASGEFRNETVVVKKTHLKDYKKPAW